jgi:diguanylate cyclase (GGDEF)-like protein/PAS domain S-box-containing protein
MSVWARHLLPLFTGSVKRQLIWGVALVHAAMMTLFVYDLSNRQKDFLVESQASQAISLAKNLSLIAAIPLLSSDFSGLQELTMAISRYPGVVYVMVIGADGKVLAHGDRSVRGKYIADFPQISASTAPQEVLYKSASKADVLEAISVNETRIGWVRLGVSQDETASKLAAIAQSGLFYTTAAILAGIVLAWVLARRLTYRLDALVKVANSVQSGGLDARARTGGNDELGRLAMAFNYMLNSLDDRTKEEKSLRVALQAEKELAQVTLASIGDAVITTNGLGLVTFLNDAACALTGLEREAAIGRSVSDVFPLTHMGSTLAMSNPVLEILNHSRGSRSEFHGGLLTSNALTIPVESLASPIFSMTGELIGSVLVARDVSEKYKVQDRLQWQAGHDALTGLPNRALLADRFDRALDKAKRNASQLVVCLLDLDHFKPINDTYGHDIGDKLLVEVVTRLNQQMRDVDTLSRLGGDEFVILLEDLENIDDVDGLMQRILEILAEPFCIDDQILNVSASIGISVFPTDNADPDTLLRHADQAMYVAKQTGRNRYHLFDLRQDFERESMHQTVQRVRQAITNNELLLYFQPKVNLESGSIAGFEALLRWQHPQDGMIPPLSFLPVVEQSDVIVEIGEWVIEQALRQIKHWQQIGQDWPISVNIAARHFQTADFLERLVIILARYPEVPASRLEFEILESVALGDVQAMNALIASCRNLGIQFSLDDFGTGYSSLSYLKRIPVQTLKIDQSFVRDMLKDPDDMALVESIINIAKLFRLHVVAEGVESQQQGLILQRLGCNLVQGYGIARPMPVDQCVNWASRYLAGEHWTGAAQASQSEVLQWTKKITDA